MQILINAHSATSKKQEGHDRVKTGLMVILLIQVRYISMLYKQYSLQPSTIIILDYRPQLLTLKMYSRLIVMNRTYLCCLWFRNYGKFMCLMAI